MIRLQLLGGVAVTSPDTLADAVVPRRRALALLAVVAASAQQAIPRDKLLAILWPESDTARARNSLRQTIFALRRDLHEDIFLPESSGGLQLDPEHASVDLWDFRDALARNTPADAVAVYRGPFLDGFHVSGLSAFSQWMDAERDRIERQHVAAVDRLAQCAAAQGRLEEAVMWRRRQAEADPLSAKAALALLEALVAAGDRPSALRYAASHERLMRQELELEADPVVTEFVASLRRDTMLEGARPALVETRAWAATPAVATSVTTAMAGWMPSTHVAMLTPPTSVSAISESSASDDADLLRSLRGAVRVRERSARPHWLAFAAGALLVGAVVAGRWVTTATPSGDAAIPTMVILGSGPHPAAGRDPTNRLVACHGPACPTGPLPQDAFVVPPNPAYPAPVTGTNYIAPVADATDAPPPGYACCTTAVFEHAFRLPPNAISATITVNALADNRASVAINGVPFGTQSDSVDAANYDNPTRFTTTFVPDPSGTNRLDVTLWDAGGALGLQYVGTVTYELAPDAHKEAAANQK